MNINDGNYIYNKYINHYKILSERLIVQSQINLLPTDKLVTANMFIRNSKAVDPVYNDIYESPEKPAVSV